MFAFETFKRDAAPIKGPPLATIQKRGALTLNRVAFEALGRPAAVEFLYDRERRVVGVRAAEAGAPNSYPARKLREADTRIVAMMAFLSHYGIDYSVTRRYEARLHGDTLVFDLNSPIPDAPVPVSNGSKAEETEAEEQ